MTKWIMFCVFLSWFPISNLSAQTSGGLEAVDEYAQAALTPIEMVYDDVSAQMQEYLNSPTAARFDQPGVHLEQGVATVNVSASHRDWAKYRVLAYKEAWAVVQENFIRYQMNDTSTELVRRLYADASGEIPTYAPDEYSGNSTIDEFIDKSGAYLGKKLDAALENVGVDPDEYERADRKQRTTLLESAIQQETVTRSVGKLTGLWPLMSFAGSVDDRYAIGVIGIYKPVFEEVASEIAKGKIPHSSSKNGKPIRDRVTDDRAALSNSFGVRLVRDENGYPALISFGQWGVSGSHRNPAISAKFRDVAIKQARSQADAELALFLNGSANFNDRSVVGSVLKDYMDVDSSGFTESGSSSTITDMIDQVLKARGRAKLSGLHDLRTWTYVHPDTGHRMVGVVRVWTTGDAMASAAIRSGANSARSEASPTKEPTKTEKELKRTSAQSPEYADPDDF